jgi:photosystem II stability/assembly factor-like uncharacterized protein
MIRPMAVTITVLALTSGCRAPGPPSTNWERPGWLVQYADSTALLIAVAPVDSSVVWASGSGGRVARTTDGGVTWAVMVVPGADSLQFRDVHAFSGQEAFVLSIGNGTDSRIYHTTDGGASWALSFQNTDSTAFFDCLSFWDRERGLAFSDSHDGEFTLIQTTDGGATWRRIDPSIVPDARPGEGAFASSGTCVVTRPGGLGWFVTGASGVDTRVIRTGDYGVTWQEAVTPIASPNNTSGISSLAMLDDRTGAIVGGNVAGGPDSSLVSDVAVTADGGATWQPAGHTGLATAPYGVSYVPGAPTATLVAVSPSGSAYSIDNGATWSRIDSVNSWAVAFVSPSAGWAVGRGHISRFTSRRTP